MITFEKMLQWIKQQLGNLKGKKATAAADVSISAEMQSEISEWQKRYAYKQHDGRLKLPAVISSEMARLVTLEMSSEITGSPRADFLNGCYAEFLPRIKDYVEQAAAIGGVIFKPFVSGDKIQIECVQGNAFYPTKFDSSGRLTGAIFVEQLTANNTIYTRLEAHDFDGKNHTVINKAFVAKNSGTLGGEIPLTDVPEWADISPEATLYGVNSPMFAYFKMPGRNNVDTSSPLGVSVYANALDLIDDAERQWADLLWEFEGGELAVFASDTALRHDPTTGEARAPKLWERLIRTLDFGTDGDNSYHEFAPALRDISILNGLNAILRRIEFNCGLAYGTLSDVQQTDKTAEEVKASKQRSFATVASIQTALENSLRQLIEILDTYTTLYKLAPAGKYEVSFCWDDSLVTDRDKEFTQRMSMQTACGLRPEINVAWYFGVTEEQAKEMIANGDAADFWGGA